MLIAHNENLVQNGNMSTNITKFECLKYLFLWICNVDDVKINFEICNELKLPFQFKPNEHCNQEWHNYQKTPHLRWRWNHKRKKKENSTKLLCDQLI